VILCEKYIKNKGGEIIISQVSALDIKKEENYFETAKKYLLNDPKDLLDILIHYD